MNRDENKDVYEFATWVKQFIFCDKCPHNQSDILCEHAGLNDKDCVNKILAEYEKEQKGE